MSLRTLCFWATLATMVALLAVERSNVKGVDVPTSNSRPQHSTLADDGPPWHMEPATDEVGRWRRDRTFRAKTKARPAVFLPVQSRETKDLSAGKVLVASRDLADPNFAETVVLLVQYDAEGVVGLILNRRTDVPLSQVLDEFKAAKGRSDRVYLGGPVETPSVFGLLRRPAKLKGAEHIFDGVYLVSTKPLFEQIISSQLEPSVFHVYLGYAAWTRDQLRKEVELGAWFIFQADAETVFNSDPDSLWSQMIQKTELKLAGNEPVEF